MSPLKRYAKKQAKARARRRHSAQERLERDQRQAQQAAEALHHTLEALGLPEDLVAEIEGRLSLQRHFSALTKFAHVESRFFGRKQQGKVVFYASVTLCVRKVCRINVAVGI